MPTMRRDLTIPALTIGLVAIVLVVFAPVLFRGEQFAYRDAGQYYYPLHGRTVEQWRSGRVPLWDAGENGGMTLIGNPTAAVLYPGKLVFAAFSFAWASRLYLIGHVVLAFATTFRMMRSAGAGAAASAIAGLSYAFGGAVVFQTCNAIYLVGAAWLPLGLMSADRWLRLGHRRALAGLAFALAMQCLGGDIEAAYLLGLFSAAYGVWLGLGATGRLRWRVAGLVATAWVVAVLGLAAWLPSWRETAVSTSVASWGGRVAKGATLALIGWGISRASRQARGAVARNWGGLIAAAVVGGAIAGAQLVPVAELASQSFRMADDNRMDVYGFSVEPYRLAECLFPGFFGIEYPEDRLWLLAVPPLLSHALWTASLYGGGLALILAIAALFGGEDARRLRGPLMVMTAAALLLSFGRFGSPLWWARYLPGVAKTLGPHGPSGSFFFRSEDGFVRDSFGSPYWLLATLAPGFEGFRFPAKLLPFAALGGAALSGLGWDRVASGAAREARRIALGAAVLGIAGLLVTFAIGPRLLAWWTESRMVPSIAGPIDAAGALFELRRALVHGAVVAGLSVVVIASAARGRRRASGAAVLLLAVDLAVANARLLWTIPQAEFDRPPRAAEILRAAERDHPTPGPFRIARLPEWHPIAWIRTRSPDRLREIIAWERDTLQSGHGTLQGLAYTLTPGVLEPEAYVDLFQPATVELSPEAASLLGLRAGRPIRYFPRRAFDLWGARYFLLPIVADDWLDPNRAIAAFLLNTEPLWPDRATGSSAEWREREDWQLLRNPAAYPRAWVVHDIRFRPPMEPGTEASRSVKKSLLYQGDPFWTMPGRPVDDPRRTAWVEADDPKSVGVRGDEGPPSAPEGVTIEGDRPGRVEMTATLERDGLVVVADTFAPGWKATIDGRAAPIFRTNRAMRGVAAARGVHRVVFTYEPGSFRAGLILSGAGLLGLAGLLIAPRFRRRAKEV